MERGHERRRLGRNAKIAIAIGAAGLLLAGSLSWIAHNNKQGAPPEQAGAHGNIATTMFWVGEAADESNAFIQNSSSTWLEDWAGAYGGVDDPNNRCNLLPCDFTPKENPFYFALPYNDLDESCNAKPSQKDVPWFSGPPPHGHSIIKNHWIKIQHSGKTAYAQWEDAGPMGEDDTNYVFGNADPHYEKAGLDLSPAATEYLGLDGQGKTTWRFVDEKNVPNGPWRQTVTTSLPDCAS